MTAAATHTQLSLDLRQAARHLVAHPLVIAEQRPKLFRLIRRHEQKLDQWFTRRYGYRLQVTADTARLFKSTVVASRRPLYVATHQKRPFSVREYTMLALALAAVVSGTNVISLRDLVRNMRGAAAEAGIAFAQDPADRRALVAALRWMISHGVAAEMHDRVDSYVTNDAADAVLKVRPDRVALLPLPVLARTAQVHELLDRSDQRRSQRIWVRAMLLEEPVVYRKDFTDKEWAELRRRLGEESNMLAEMFDMRLEVRAEGVMAVDPDGEMTDSRFPGAGTVRHAALLLIDRLCATDCNPVARSAVLDSVEDLAREYRPYWSNLADDPKKLAREILALLCDHRMIDFVADDVHLLPAAWRFAVDVEFEQASLL